MIEYRNAREEVNEKLERQRELAAALREGELARAQGKSRLTCPYLEGPLRQAWLRGWWKEF